MRFISKVAGLAMFLLLITVACGGGSSPSSSDAPGSGGASEPVAAELKSVSETSPEEVKAFGKATARVFVCNGCHTVDGVGAAGPTWLGLFGKEETLEDGTTVIVDEAYLRESILDPNAKIVKDFPADVMPADFAERLSDSQLDLLIEYIKVLK
ncbi:MAG: hypothetical protein BZY80_05780 [SAR202 cluster bacterium Io17-Chloro-G2]|nr:MAG: hypothetical protein BZY80_05780 [SAR202 cluster bacterium Io17-Chloro-G2]